MLMMRDAPPPPPPSSASAPPPNPRTTLAELFSSSPPHPPFSSAHFRHRLSPADKFKLRDQLVSLSQDAPSFSRLRAPPPGDAAAHRPAPPPPPPTRDAYSQPTWNINNNGFVRVAAGKQPMLDPPRPFNAATAIASCSLDQNQNPIPISPAAASSVDFRHHLRRVHPAHIIRSDARKIFDADFTAENPKLAPPTTVNLAAASYDRTIFDDDGYSDRDDDHDPLIRLPDPFAPPNAESVAAADPASFLAPKNDGASAQAGSRSSAEDFSLLNSTKSDGDCVYDDSQYGAGALPSSSSESVREDGEPLSDSERGGDGGDTSVAERKERLRKVKFRKSILYMPSGRKPSAAASTYDDPSVDRSIREDVDQSWQIPILQKFQSIYMQDDHSGVVDPTADDPPSTTNSTFDHWGQSWRSGEAAKGGGVAERSVTKMAKIRKGLVAMAKESSVGMVPRWRRQQQIDRKGANLYWSQELVSENEKRRREGEMKKYSWSQELVAGGGRKQYSWSQELAPGGGREMKQNSRSQELAARGDSALVREARGGGDSKQAGGYAEIREEDKEEEDEEEEEGEVDKRSWAAEESGGKLEAMRDAVVSPVSSASSSGRKSSKASNIIEKIVKMRRSGSGSRVGGSIGAGGAKAAVAKKKVVIEEGKIGLGWEGGVPLMLAAGEYELSEVEVERVVSEESELVRHGNLHRVKIKGGGHVGVVWAEGLAEPRLLNAGSVAVFSSSPGRFRLLTTTEEMLSLPDFALGPFRVVTVPPFHVGVMFAHRLPRPLPPGRHYLTMSKLEVFAGLESLLKRESDVNAIIATSKDDMEVIGDVHMEWQVKAEDVVKARLANIMNVENDVHEKARRAFCLAMWEINGEELQRDIMKESGILHVGVTSTQQQRSLKSISTKVSTECMELFEEGWRIVLWDLQVNNVVVSSKTQRTEDNP